MMFRACSAGFPGNRPLKISIIVPARDAADTLAETLRSVLYQTMPDWEVMVIDDGSMDETRNIATTFAQKDNRISVASGPGTGVSSARNEGIKRAKFDWLLFLDADDWILPRHLECLIQILLGDPCLDAAYCGWAKVAPDGTRVFSESLSKAGDMFEILAAHCCLAIHSCIVRRTLVDLVGGFDPSLRTCEDWDLWQRIARTGAHFGMTPEVLALYRMRPNSASVDGLQLLRDGLRVIKQGHTPDNRVPNPDPEHREGLPFHRVTCLNFQFCCWCAGLVLGQGGDARPLLSFLGKDICPNLNPQAIAMSIFQAMLQSACLPPAEGIRMLLRVKDLLNDFLRELEEQSKTSGLASRTCKALERAALKHGMPQEHITINSTHGTCVEITEPIPDLSLPFSIERLICKVKMGGAYIGTIELPVCDGIVPGSVLSDAIAEKFAWPILGSFFESTVYADLQLKEEEGGTSIYRENVCLAEGLSEEECNSWENLHDRIGWTVFLQEIWGKPNWPQGCFYDLKTRQRVAMQRSVDENWLVVEVSEEFPDFKVSGKEIKVVLTVGGIAIGHVNVPVESGTVSAQHLRAALTIASGFELCLTAVREGLLGRPIAEPTPLRTRLVMAKVTTMNRTEATDSFGLSPNILLAPGAEHALRRVSHPHENAMVIARRSCGAMGTSVSRRAMLPKAALGELLNAASVTEEPVIPMPGTGNRPDHVIYAPDVLWGPAKDSLQARKGLPPFLMSGKDAVASSWNNLVTAYTFLSGSVKGWGGCIKRHRISRRIVTERLPIVMYHRVEKSGVPGLERYCVTPCAFEEQLQYLCKAGFYGVRLEDWRAAREAKKPLPGRALIII